MNREEWFAQLFTRLGNSKFRSSFKLKKKDIQMNQDLIVSKVHAILENAMPGVFSKYKDHIADYFAVNSKLYDMYIKIDIFDTQAEIFTQERGQRIITYHTDNESVVIYTILNDIIGLEAENTTWEEFANKDTESLHYSNETREFQKNIKDDAFAKAGTPYDEWHKQGINFFTLDKII